MTVITTTPTRRLAELTFDLDTRVVASGAQRELVLVDVGEGAGDVGGVASRRVQRRLRQVSLFVSLEQIQSLGR